jgi:hypothetical protein
MCLECFDKLPVFCYMGKEYIDWQNNEICRVGFSEVPKIGNKEINKAVMSKEEIKRAKEKPLFLVNTLEVCLVDKTKNKFYVFTIPAGFDYDGASINRILWRIIGSKENIEFKVASLVHDVLCLNHDYVDNDRYFSTIVFERLLEVGDVGAFRRWVMKHSVDNFQKFCGWRAEAGGVCAGKCHNAVQCEPPSDGWN